MKKKNVCSTCGTQRCYPEHCKHGKKKEKMVQISLRLPVALVKRIDKLAKHEGISRSAWIRRAIQQHLGRV